MKIAGRVPPLLLLATLASVVLFCGFAAAATGGEVRKRIGRDAAAGRPVVIHATVALSGSGGKAPDESPWWSGANGLKTALTQKSGWKLVEEVRPPQPGPLVRLVLGKALTREGRQTQVYLVADGWEERHIQKALVRFYAHARGAEEESVTLGDGARKVGLRAGGGAHVAAFLGRNGMEDVEPIDDDTYNISPEEEWLRRAAARPDSAFDVRPQVDAEKPVGAVVLCSDSKAYFLDKLKREGAHPVLLTVGSHLPEAWSLDAAVGALVAGGQGNEVWNAAAEAYSRGLGVGREAARQKFWSGE